MIHHPIRFFMAVGAVLAVPVLFAVSACDSSNEKQPKALSQATPPPVTKSARPATAPIVQTAAEQETVKEFEKRANDYAAFHQKLEESIPALSDKATPEEMVKHQQVMAAMIQKERKNATPGEFFTPDTIALLKRILGGALSGADDKAAKASVMDENPGTLPNVGVNDKYPDGIPVTSMPPELIDQLPKLPEKMEFRFLGKRLVLVDSCASLVVDITPNLLP